MKIILFAFLLLLCFVASFRHKFKVRGKGKLRHKHRGKFRKLKLKEFADPTPRQQNLMNEWQEFPGEYLIVSNPDFASTQAIKLSHLYTSYGILFNPLEEVDFSFFDHAMVSMKTLYETDVESKKAYTEAVLIMKDKNLDIPTTSQHYIEAKKIVDDLYKDDLFSYLLNQPQVTKSSFVIPYKYIKNCEGLRLSNSGPPVTFKYIDFTPTDREIDDILNKYDDYEAKEQGITNHVSRVGKDKSTSHYFNLDLIQVEEYHNIKCQNPENTPQKYFNVKLIWNPVNDEEFAPESTDSGIDQSVGACNQILDNTGKFIKQYGVALKTVHNIFDELVDLFKVKKKIHSQTKGFLKAATQLRTFFTSDGLASKELVEIQKEAEDLSEEASAFDTLNPKAPHKVYDLEKMEMEQALLLKQDALIKLKQKINLIKCFPDKDGNASPLEWCSRDLDTGVPTVVAEKENTEQQNNNQ